MKEEFAAGETITAIQSVAGNTVVLEGILFDGFECPVVVS